MYTVRNGVIGNFVCPDFNLTHHLAPPSLASKIRNQYRVPNNDNSWARKTTRPPVLYPLLAKDTQNARTVGSPTTGSNSTHHQPHRRNSARHHGDPARHLRAPAIPDLR